MIPFTGIRTLCEACLTSITSGWITDPKLVINPMTLCEECYQEGTEE